MLYKGFGGSNSAIILEESPTATRKLINGNSHSNGTITNGTRITKGDSETANGTHVPTHNGNEVLNNVGNQPPKRVYVLSAKSENSLTTYLSSFQEYLDTSATVDGSSAFVENLAFTLGQRRTHHSYRVAATADSLDGLKTQLAAAKPRKIRDRAIAFVFTGQGAQ